MKRLNFNETYRCMRYFRSCFCFDLGEINGSINGKQTSIPIQICYIYSQDWITKTLRSNTFVKASMLGIRGLEFAW